jgi:hypothetical protein
MPNVTLHVTPQGDNLLNVDQSGNGNHIAHGETVTITWHLDVPGNEQGSFNAISDDPGTSGFTWIQAPNPAIFSGPQRTGNANKKITITDHNNDPNGINSTGDWVYQLRATIGTHQYWTTTTLSNPRVVTTNPTIKNM